MRTASRFDMVLRVISNAICLDYSSPPGVRASATRRHTPQSAYFNRTALCQGSWFSAIQDSVRQGRTAYQSVIAHS